jgi:hypothetical protein
MADFCKQCSEEIFGEDHGDLKPLNPEPLEAGEGYAVLCEGCGPTLVDNEGKCLWNCLKHHGAVK